MDFRVLLFTKKPSLSEREQRETCLDFIVVTTGVSSMQKGVTKSRRKRMQMFFGLFFHEMQNF